MDQSHQDEGKMRDRVLDVLSVARRSWLVGVFSAAATALVAAIPWSPVLAAGASGPGPDLTCACPVLKTACGGYICPHPVCCGAHGGTLSCHEHSCHVQSVACNNKNHCINHSGLTCCFDTGQCYAVSCPHLAGSVCSGCVCPAC